MTLPISPAFEFTTVRHWSVAGLGAALLLGAVFFPAARVAGHMHGLDTVVVLQGLSLMRLAMGALGAALLGLVCLPTDWFRHPGLPRSATGLRVGPLGWAQGSEHCRWWWLGIILLAGTFLRIYRLDTDLWLDEVMTVVDYMRSSVWKNLYTYESANQHVVNSLLGHLSIGVFGEHAWSARLPAAFFGIGGLWALYYLARAITTQREALVATALLAVSYHHVWFSQNARGYTAMVFWGLLGTALLLRAIARNRSGDWVLYGLSMALGVWSLLNTAFILAAHLAAYCLLLVNWKIDWGLHRQITARLLASVMLTGLFIALLYSNYVPGMVSFFFPDEASVALQWFSLGAALQDGITAGVGVFGLLAVPAALIMLAIGWVSYCRQSVLVAGLFVFPVLFNAVAVIVLHFPAFPRSFLYVLPFGILLVVRASFMLCGWIARGLATDERTRQRLEQSLVVAVVGAMFVASCLMLVHNYRYPKQDYLGALAYVRQHSASGDRICAAGLAVTVYRDYYAPQLCAVSSPQKLDQIQTNGHRVWVIYTFRRIMRTTSPDLYRYVTHRLEPVAVLPGTLGDGDVYISRTPVGDKK